MMIAMMLIDDAEKGCKKKMNSEHMRTFPDETVLFVTGDYVLVSQGTSWQTSQMGLVS